MTLEISRYKSGIKSLIEVYSVEGGYTHPAEKIVREFLENYHDEFMSWLVDMYVNEPSSMYYLTETIKLTSRMDKSIVGLDIILLLRSMLVTSDPVLKDAIEAALCEFGETK